MKSSAVNFILLHRVRITFSALHSAYLSLAIFVLLLNVTSLLSGSNNSGAIQPPVPTEPV